MSEFNNTYIVHQIKCQKVKLIKNYSQIIPCFQFQKLVEIQVG